MLDLIAFIIFCSLASFQDLPASETTVLEDVPECIEREADEESESSAKVGDQRNKRVAVNLRYQEHKIALWHLHLNYLFFDSHSN